MIDHTFLYPTNAGKVSAGDPVPHGPATVTAGPVTRVNARLEVAGACLLNNMLAVNVTASFSDEVPLVACCGDAYGGLTPADWPASVDCGTIAGVRIVEIPVSSLPPGTQYVRFCADDICWSPIIDLSTCVITGPRVFIEQVESGNFSVSLAGRLYGDSAGVTLSARAALSGDASATEFPSVSSVNEDGTFTITIYQLNSSRSYDIAVLPNELADSAGTTTVTTLPPADIPWRYGASVGVVEDGDQAVLSFAPTSEAMDIVMLTGLTTVGDSAADWATQTVVGSVEAGATTATVDLPANWGDGVYAVRYILRPAGVTLPLAESQFYQTTAGGTMYSQFDAIDNVGVGQHSNEPTAWKDLQGERDLTMEGAPVWTDDNVDLAGAGWFIMESDRTLDALVNGNLTIELLIRVQRYVQYQGILSIGPLDASNRRVLYLDSRANSGLGNQIFGGLQFLTSAWDGAKHTMTTLGYVNEWVSLAIAIEGTGSSAKAQLSIYDPLTDAFVVKHTTPKGNLTNLSNLLQLGRKESGSPTQMHVKAMRLHEGLLTPEALRVNRLIDRHRYFADGAFPDQGVPASDVFHCIQSVGFALGGTESESEGASGTHLVLSGTYSGTDEPETITVAWTAGGVNRETAAAFADGVWTATLQPVDYDVETPYTVAAASAAGLDRITRSFKLTTQTVVDSVSLARMGNTGRVQVNFRIAESGVGDTVVSVVAGSSAATMVPTDFSMVVPHGDTDPKTFIYNTQAYGHGNYFCAVVFSNAFDNAALGSWTTQSSTLSFSLSNSLDYYWTGPGADPTDWNDYDNWQVLGPYGRPTDERGPYPTTASTVRFPAGTNTFWVSRTRTVARFIVGTGNTADTQYLDVRGKGTNAVLNANISAAGVTNPRNLGLLFTDVEVNEENGFEFGSSTSSYNNLLRAAGTSQVRFNGNLHLNSSGGSAVEVADTALLAPIGFMLSATKDFDFRFFGLGPKMEAQYLNVNRADQDIRFTFKLPADFPRKGYAVAPLTLTGTNVFANVLSGSGKLVVRLDPDSPFFANIRPMATTLISAAAGIAADNVVAEDQNVNGALVTYSYGHSTGVELPTELKVAVVRPGFLMIVR